MSIPNCVPEFYRSRIEDKEHKEEQRFCRLAHYAENRKKREEAYAEGFPVIPYGGYDFDCFDCPTKDDDTQCSEEDDFCYIICKNKDCPKHKER